jgi:hypothetical protein
MSSLLLRGGSASAATARRADDVMVAEAAGPVAQGSKH